MREKLYLYSFTFNSLERERNRERDREKKDRERDRDRERERERERKSNALELIKNLVNISTGEIYYCNQDSNIKDEDIIGIVMRP